jgi:dihydropteroate synthase
MSPDDFVSWLADPRRPPLVMGVLNVTPDSFSDAGRWADPLAAVTHARQMADAGADLMDIGGESTRPGSQRVPADEQIRRILPVVETLMREIGQRCVLSIDTTLAPVAKAALDAGATVINDISGGSDDRTMFDLAASRRSPIVLMHMQGQPATMQLNPAYTDVVQEVRSFLLERAQAAIRTGVPRTHVLLDPGIGFGKNVNHNLELLRHLSRLAELGHPLVLGTSRKGFIGRIAGEPEPSQRLFGTAATVAWCVANGAAIVRVHDVEPMSKVVRVIRAIQVGWNSETT